MRKVKGIIEKLDIMLIGLFATLKDLIYKLDLDIVFVLLQLIDMEDSL
jgi:hypothetical protein